MLLELSPADINMHCDCMYSTVSHLIQYVLCASSYDRLIQPKVDENRA